MAVENKIQEITEEQNKETVSLNYSEEEQETFNADCLSKKYGPLAQKIEYLYLLNKIYEGKDHLTSGKASNITRGDVWQIRKRTFEDIKESYAFLKNNIQDYVQHEHQPHVDENIRSLLESSLNIINYHSKLMELMDSYKQNAAPKN